MYLDLEVSIANDLAPVLYNGRRAAWELSSVGEVVMKTKNVRVHLFGSALPCASEIRSHRKQDECMFSVAQRRIEKTMLAPRSAKVRCPGFLTDRAVQELQLTQLCRILRGNSARLLDFFVKALDRCTTLFASLQQKGPPLVHLDTRKR